MYRQLLIMATLFFSVVHMNPDPIRSPKIYNALISSDENLQPSHAYPLVEPVLRTTALGVAFPPLIIPQVPQQILDPKQPLDYPDYKSQALEPVEQIVAETPASVISAQSAPDGQPKINHYGSLFPLAYEPAYLQYANGLRLPVQQPLSYYQPYDQNAHLPPVYLNHLMPNQQIQKQDGQLQQLHQQQQVVQQPKLNIAQQEQPQEEQLHPESQKSTASPETPHYPVQPPSPFSAPGLGVNFQKNPDIPDVPPPPLPISNKRRQ